MTIFVDTTNGSNRDDIIVQILPSLSQTVHGNGGNDYMLAADGPAFLDLFRDNASSRTALDIDDADFWTISPANAVVDDATPRTTILGQGAGQTDWFSVTIGEGQTITIDIDAAGTGAGGVPWDAQVELLDARGRFLQFADDANVTDGGLGSTTETDSYLVRTITDPGTYYIHVGALGDGGDFRPIAKANAYVLNVSVTGHDNAGEQTVSGVQTLYGDAGDDVLIGNVTQDRLYGGVGEDRMYGGGGDDTVSLEDGSTADTIDGGDGSDTLDLGLTSAGWTITRGNNSSEPGNAISSNGDYVTFVGVEVFFGSSGDDVYRSGSETISFFGGAGDDLVDTSAYDADQSYNINLDAGSSDFADRFFSVENFTTGATRDFIFGTSANNVISTNEGDDAIDGYDGDDTLSGGTGRDDVNGGRGDDVISGGRGRDTLSGGLDTDLFVFVAGDTGKSARTADRIVDFKQSEGDRIDLTGYDADATRAGVQTFVFVGQRQFDTGGSIGQLRYEVQGRDTVVLGDTNGDGAADLAIVLEQLANPLKARDFLLSAAAQVGGGDVDARPVHEAIFALAAGHGGVVADLP